MLLEAGFRSFRSLQDAGASIHVSLGLKEVMSLLNALWNLSYSAMPHLLFFFFTSVITFVCHTYYYCDRHATAGDVSPASPLDTPADLARWKTYRCWKALRTSSIIVCDCSVYYIHDKLLYLIDHRTSYKIASHHVGRFNQQVVQSVQWHLPGRLMSLSLSRFVSRSQYRQP